MSILNFDETLGRLPERFFVSVIMERSPSTSAWTDDCWEAVGVTVAADSAADKVVKIYDEQGVQRYLHSGFKLKLHVDECESYYHNLMSPTPRCYVVADPGENEVPVPMLVSLSFDEAHAYLEGDETVYSVDIPPELYRWTEAFVLSHYVPTKKIKRKLTDWKESGQRREKA